MTRGGDHITGICARSIAMAALGDRITAGGYFWCAVKDWYPGWKPKKEYSDIYKKKFPMLSKY